MKLLIWHRGVFVNIRVFDKNVLKITKLLGIILLYKKDCYRLSIFWRLEAFQQSWLFPQILLSNTYFYDSCVLLVTVFFSILQHPIFYIFISSTVANLFSNLSPNH